mmetsp:Transcript_81658/g.144031  ORF Transcript_81658/g.144031 Transcript_81658/m.144031 type:complete len:86 (+) Transcript_81658:520-777(+)
MSNKKKHGSIRTRCPHRFQMAKTENVPNMPTWKGCSGIYYSDRFHTKIRILQNSNNNEHRTQLSFSTYHFASFTPSFGPPLTLTA